MESNQIGKVNTEPMLDRVRKRILESENELGAIGGRALILRDKIFGPRDEPSDKQADPPPANSSFQLLLDACIALEKRVVMLGKVVDELQQLA